ncbi:threonine--tRNA ligase [Candidatus Uhrbacteria bacterium]|nr:threonine--tRNA ligase [Candidatus Uhrbacteria bacterium]
MDYPIEFRRHSAAHVMAAAIKQLFPEAKFGVGPVVEHGFYYDIDIGRPVTAEDLKAIQKGMQKIVNQNPAFVREEVDIDDAIKLFDELGQTYKLELLNDLKTKGTTKVSVEEAQDIDPQNVGSVTLYRTAEFVDLCRGPHVTEAKDIGVWKLHKVAGAYWRGKETNPQMQRIYGLCFATKEELAEYEAMVIEAEKRDHRKLGQELELFHIDEMVGKGLVLWLPKGAAVRQQVENLAMEMEGEYGYERVVTPHIAKEELFLTSGHLPYYKDDMYPAMVMDDGTYYMKAMNCPHHHIIYRHKPRSYRELPVRLAEYGTVYRNERSGTLAGLLRVRALAMNDAHIYCRKDQIKDEFKRVMELTMGYFKIFGLENFWFRLSKWSPDHLDKYVNEPDNWEYSQNVLREVLIEMDVPFKEIDNEAAFYGPKVDVMFKSVIGREETMSTVQLDFIAKTRFGLEYTDEKGEKNGEIFVIHRAPLSTHERFMAFLIEHYAGAFPLWLAPVQIAVLPVADRHVEFAQSLAKELSALGLRVSVDDSTESVGKKIRNAEKQKYPRMLVVGDREAGGGALTVRIHGEPDQQEISKEEFIKKSLHEIKSRTA